MGKETIVSPVDGEIIELENVLDDVFSSGIMGDGFGVIPTSKNFYSPVSGKVENAYKTGHAYTIVSDDGLDVLIHIGIDTVELEGEYFDSKISSGECLKKGDIIAYADIDKIMEKGFDPVCVVVVTNSDKLHNVDIKYGQCYSGDTVMEYEQK
jgi:glucose-specific phosphotransferase system IIA component